MTRLLVSALMLVSPILSAQPSTAPSRQGQVHIAQAGSPDSVGFSSPRLERLHSAMQDLVDRHVYPGVVTILARHGKLVETRAYGKRDLNSGTPMTQDSIFRLYSMTKPVTGAALMILFEEGKWKPTDPVAKFLPELAQVQVFRGVDGDGRMLLGSPAHPPTMAELMTHTAGFSYGDSGLAPVDNAYEEGKIFEATSSNDFVQRVARLPLLYQPGTRWIYSIASDLQGVIVERLSGRRLDDFLAERLFGPLGMDDSGFCVPSGKRERFATLYKVKADGSLEATETAEGRPSDLIAPPKVAFGGHGMVSTAKDYFRFAQMLCNGGQLGGVRILAPSTVRLMTSNHLGQHLLTGEFFDGFEVMRPGAGWGYGGRSYADPPLVDEVVGKNTYAWKGVADTWFWEDPSNDLVFVGMAQRLAAPGRPDIQRITRPLVYQALVEPEK